MNAYVLVLSAPLLPQADAAIALASMGALAAALMVPCMSEQSGLALVAWGANAGFLAANPATLNAVSDLDVHVAVQVCSA